MSASQTQTVVVGPFTITGTAAQIAKIRDMAQHIADPCDLRPWDFWVPGFQLVAQMPARLGDDLNAALDRRHEHAIHALAGK